MLRFFKPKRHDPDEIARAVLAASSDLAIFERFWKEFAPGESDCPRVFLSMVIFAYCWASGWSKEKKDSRVSEAYGRAADVIASRFKDAANLVQVSDYLVSSSEITTFYFALSKHFGLQIPVDVNREAEAETILDAHAEATRSYRVGFKILFKTVCILRGEKMVHDLSVCSKSNLPMSDALMLLSFSLNEQISGLKQTDIADDPDLLTEEFMVSQPRRLEALAPLLARLMTELESL